MNEMLIFSSLSVTTKSIIYRLHVCVLCITAVTVH